MLGGIDNGMSSSTVIILIVITVVSTGTVEQMLSRKNDFMEFNAN